MYDGLTPLFNRVTQSDLTRYFKSGRLGKAAGATREERIPGRPGISIQRDEFNVPHIRGATDDDVTFAVGWVSAEDRGLLFEQARYNARAAAVDAPGLSALELTAQLLNFQPSAQTEAEVAKQAQVLESKGEKGRQVLHDIDVYLEGANGYLRSSGSNAKPVTRTDIFALNALKGQFVGQGGGRETSASMLLSGLRKQLGSSRGRSVFNDLRQRRVKGTQVTVDGRFPYAPDPEAHAGQRHHRQRLVQVHRGGGRARRRGRHSGQQRDHGHAQALDQRQGAYERGPADRLLLPGLRARGRHRGTELRRRAASPPRPSPATCSSVAERTSRSR